MQPSEIQTTCAFCDSTVSSALRFCPRCGKPLTHRPTCPSCGAELVPGRQFCSQCGAKILLLERDPHQQPVPAPDSAGIPARNGSPVITTGPQASGPVNTPASGGSALIKIALFAGVVIVLGVILLIVIGLIFMVIPTGDTDMAGSTTPGSLAPAEIRPTAQDVQEREAVRTAAVTALHEGNTDGFRILLMESDQDKYPSGLGLSAEGMKALAATISAAKITEETSRSAVYETQINGKMITFMAIKEEGIWKLAGI